MAYTPTNWQNGDVITADKLNKLENGVASAGGGSEELLVTFTIVNGDEDYELSADKTFAEVSYAITEGIPVRGVMKYFEDTQFNSISCVLDIESSASFTFIANIGCMENSGTPGNVLFGMGFMYVNLTTDNEVLITETNMQIDASGTISEQIYGGNNEENA